MLEVFAAVAVVVYVLVRQVMGQPLRGRRVVLLPAVVTLVGLSRLHGQSHALGAADVVLLAVGALLAAGIGAGQGAMTRLQERDGGLWGKMPPRGLLLWVALVVSRLALAAVAVPLHAHVAASTAPILLMLGVNRLGQAIAIVRRAHRSGIAFAPEKDGSVFLHDRSQRLNVHLDGFGDPPGTPAPTPPVSSPFPSPGPAAPVRRLLDGAGHTAVRGRISRPSRERRRRR